MNVTKSISNLHVLTLVALCACGEAPDSPAATTDGGGTSEGGTPAASGSASGGAVGSGSQGAGGSGGSGGAANGGSAGDGAGGAFVPGGAGGGGPAYVLDCGANGVAIESAGPPENRINYVIVGDGYDATTVNTTYLEHIETAMAKRFSSPIGEPYIRYRKFVNICAIKLVSPSNGIPGALHCTGDDESRLAECDTRAADQALKANLPEDFEVDWHAIVLNNDRWWNTGSSWMLWSGAHSEAAGAALHEGGHGFHQLADEYCAKATGAACGASMCSGSGDEYVEVNSTGNCATTAGKWDKWLGYDATDATGIQGTFIGSRYVDSEQYRPSSNSMMNSLFGNNKNTSFNPVSREKMIMDIWMRVRPIDSTDPPAGAVTDPAKLAVNVIDSDVVSVDWTLDGKVIATDGGPVYNVAAAGLASGTHTIVAKAYDNAGEEWVRYRSGECLDPPPSTDPRYYDPCWGRDNWPRSQQTVTWTVTIP
ncbi:M64 family metallopeptidase [Sorangium sp. So ce1000]|uniref:M64 family metallopeptidase n=1 Tax=Sorangium sp. So ce1000 TaxID=3133325 RepID=UPI003F60CD6A